MARMLSLPPLALALAAAVTLPSSAFFWNSGKESAQPDPEAPIARNMELTTYRDVALTGYLDAVDNQGDELTFQLTDTPARGSVELAEDGSARFVYTPYENKTGKDTFTYVAVDSQGNTSSPAEVTIHIEKPDTTVFYADLEGRPAHKAAIRLAEEDILVGRQVGDQYFFDPDAQVSRWEFLTLAMETAGLEPLEQVSLTGFADDGDIPTWSKGWISSALQAGVIQGSRDEVGAPIFQADQAVTQGEAMVMLDQLLQVSDVPLEVFAPEEQQSHWASQAAANLSACGVTTLETPALGDALTRGEAAQLLDGALDVMAQREDGWLFW